MSTRRLQARNEINVTPLIDVILQLIIFFMITTTFRSAPGISLDLPQSKTAQKVASSSVLQVRVFSNDEIYVNKNKTSLAGLRTILQQAVATMGPAAGPQASGGVAQSSQGSANKTNQTNQANSTTSDSIQENPISNIHAILEGGSGVSYQLIVSVLDELRLCGIQNVSLMTREEKVTQ
ncbi:MAG TPA: biopolymer transporter ExbD [Spirochaetales bacterium]|nr:biopolymer transporter ExbD [Spirochaetales bacterium]HPS15475.1 biopolymer transporter ExbD [Spirochaetales bacterium]